MPACLPRCAASSLVLQEFKELGFSLESSDGPRVAHNFGLEDGRTVSVPLSFYPTLQLAARRERADFEISYTSVH